MFSGNLERRSEKSGSELAAASSCCGRRKENNKRSTAGNTHTHRFPSNQVQCFVFLCRLLFRFYFYQPTQQRLYSLMRARRNVPPKFDRTPYYGLHRARVDLIGLDSCVRLFAVRPDCRTGSVWIIRNLQFTMWKFNRAAFSTSRELSPEKAVLSQKAA